MKLSKGEYEALSPQDRQRLAVSLSTQELSELLGKSTPPNIIPDSIVPRSIEITDKTITSKGKTLTISSIASVRRKAKFRKRPLGIILIIFGFIVANIGSSDKTTDTNKMLIEYKNKMNEVGSLIKYQIPGTNGYQQAIKNFENVKPPDISEDLAFDLYECGVGGWCMIIGLLYIFARRRTQYIMISTGGKEFSIYQNTNRKEADSIVSEISGKLSARV